MMTHDSRFDAPGYPRETTSSTPSSAPLEPERIQQCERLFSLGALAAGLIHELNNPLNAILMNAELGLLRLQKASDQDELMRILQKISQEAKRGGLLTRNVAEFAKAGNYAPNGSADLNSAVMQARALAHSVLRRNAVQLEWELDPEPPALNLNLTAIALAIAHLLHNAVEAGALQVRLTTGSNGRWATISMIDNGAGITPGNLPMVFEPFFTTRQAQGKIGLGLSLARRIVADHGGKIEVHSVPGDTRFVIYLPVERNQI
jgi:signal transduction histidine kinase